MPRSLLRSAAFRIGDDSDNDFKKVTKKSSPAAADITDENVMKTIDDVYATAYAVGAQQRRLPVHEGHSAATAVRLLQVRRGGSRKPRYITT